MKLVFDAQLSWRLEKRLFVAFPGCVHVTSTTLPNPATDGAIWAFAMQNGYVIVTRDEDFIELSNAKGHPPQVVFLDVVNPSTSVVAAILMAGAESIRVFTDEGRQPILLL